MKCNIAGCALVQVVLSCWRVHYGNFTAPKMLQCRNRCLAGIMTLAFIDRKGFNMLLCESDPECERLTTLVITMPGKSSVPLSVLL